MSASIRGLFGIAVLLTVAWAINNMLVTQPPVVAKEEQRESITKPAPVITEARGHLSVYIRSSVPANSI